MVYLLDTSALLAHFRSEAGADRVQLVFEDDEAEIWVASVTLAEFGRRLCDLGHPERDARQVLSSYEVAWTGVVPVDAAVALAALELGCRMRDRLPLVDALIAAAARSRKARLVHRDGHFRALPAGWVDMVDLGGPGP